MSNWNGFGSLDLTDVEAEKGRATMLPGNYICRVTNAEVKDTKDRRGKGVVVEFKDEGGGGTCDTFLNIVNPNEEAQRIGRGQLKALLIAGGHPNPDRPGDINSLKGLRVGVRIEQGDPWTDKNGNTRPGGGRVRRSGAFFDPASNEVLGPHPVQQQRAQGNPYGGGGRSGQTSGGAYSLNDEIPF